MGSPFILALWMSFKSKENHVNKLNDIRSRIAISASKESFVLEEAKILGFSKFHAFAFLYLLMITIAAWLYGLGLAFDFSGDSKVLTAFVLLSNLILAAPLMLSSFKIPILGNLILATILQLIYSYLASLIFVNICNKKKHNKCLQSDAVSPRT